ncbi:MAG: cytidylate kinase-like family protein [Desulfohalobiaceae bacterium]|nr:cytidylate kinase-like family protein [Desulfohalobiaceae bacterium]
MAIVTISRGSYTRGREVAEKLTERMNYELVSREVLIEASEHFNVSEIKLERALHNPLSVLDRFTNGKRRYFAYIENAILNHMIKNNMVYHGLTGHALIPKVNHLLRVRIRAEMEDRVARESERENISKDEARYLLSKDDEERRKWSINVTGHDPCDPSQYDIIFNASKTHVEDIVDIIASILQKDYMQNDSESQKMLEDLAKASEIKASLINQFPSVEVHVQGGTAIIRVQGSLEQEEYLKRSVREQMPTIRGIQDVRVSVIPWIG